MLPTCHPSEHSDGRYIPIGSLWFGLEVEAYLQRSGDAAFADKVSALFDFFKPFRNSDGLLERLQRWVSIEWSKANAFTQDVNRIPGVGRGASCAPPRGFHDHGRPHVRRTAPFAFARPGDIRLSCMRGRISSATARRTTAIFHRSCSGDVQ